MAINSEINAGSLRFLGCSTGILLSTAKAFTGDCFNF